VCVGFERGDGKRAGGPCKKEKNVGQL